MKKKNDIVIMAYNYVHDMGVQNQMLCMRYGLRASTLSCIAAGKVITRGRDKYLHAFVQELVRQSKFAALRNEDAIVLQITQKLACLMTILCGAEGEK